MVNFVEGSRDGTLNGTSVVTLVAAPSDSSTRRIVKSITISNTDTAAVTVTVYFTNNGVDRQIVKLTLDQGDSLVMGEEDFYVLDTINKSVTAVMSGAATTNNPDYNSCWGDAW